MDMLYPESFEKKIKFDAVRLSLDGLCESSMGRELVEAMHFTTDMESVAYALSECAEFMKILQEEEFPGGDYSDARPFFEKIRVDGLFLDVPEMAALKASLESLYAILRFFRNKAEDFPVLSAQAGDVVQFPYVIDRLNSIVSKYGTIKDNASPELSEIRFSIQKKQSGVSRRIQALLKGAQAEGWADKEASIAVREGRMVIPVPSAYKRKIRGIVHDESATGKTAYVEPEEIVEINNEIRELEIEERREIIRILRKFADDLRPYIDDLIPGYDFMANVDFVQAKARFSLNIGALVPQMTDRPEIEWYGARHPLLYLNLKQHGKAFVPLDIILNGKDRIIVISGPNAGGKSVCLQTVGLLQYMFQCGIPVPVADYSHFGIFKDILIDIGDEQSLENDLSTYSSHLINMKNFVKYGNGDSLILIDEFGTGTEPLLGGAIAESVLFRLNAQEVRGVITTHYTNLKLMAAESKGIVNGAMLYDSARMAPLFELKIGKPGSSFAFEIARKIGLPKDILDNAAAKIGEEQVNYDRHLKDIARDKRYWEEKRRKIHDNEKRLDNVIERYGNELSEVEMKRKEIIADARETAAAMLAEANRIIEKTIREIKENQAEKEKTRMLRADMEKEKEKILNSTSSGQEKEIRRKMEQLMRRKERKQKKRQEAVEGQGVPEGSGTLRTEEDKTAGNRKFRAGDWVEMANGTKGEVVKLQGKDVYLSLGDLMLKADPSGLRLLSATEKKQASQKDMQRRKNTGTTSVDSQARYEFKPEIDVRGMRVDEALPVVERFIDDAVVLGFKNVRILHGTGTGALRSVIRQWLNCNPVVGTCHDEQVQLGGAGITVVILDI